MSDKFINKLKHFVLKHFKINLTICQKNFAQS